LVELWKQQDKKYSPPKASPSLSHVNLASIFELCDLCDDEDEHAVGIGKKCVA
jgi:hypothetical protein